MAWIMSGRKFCKMTNEEINTLAEALESEGAFRERIVASLLSNHRPQWAEVHEHANEICREAADILRGHIAKDGV